MNLKPSSRIESSGISLIRHMNKYFGDGVINLGIGQLPFTAPRSLVEHGISALHEPLVYTPNQGLNNLRKLIAEEQTNKDNKAYSIDQVVVTSGAEEAIYSTLAAYLDKEDFVLVPEISFGVYEKIANFFGAYVSKFQLNGDFGIDHDSLQRKINKGTKFIILNSPSNPTGRVLESKELKELSDILNNNGSPHVISDEVYSNLYFGQKPESFSKFYENTITINGISKRSSATGLRLGWCIAPDEEIARNINQAHTLATTSASIVSQKAAIPVLQGLCLDDEKSYREILLKNRDYCLETFKELELPINIPQGSFYLFPNTSRFSKDSLELAEDIAKKARVITIPGIAFGEAGNSYLRVSFAAKESEVIEGLQRLKGYFRKISINN